MTVSSAGVRRLGRCVLGYSCLAPAVAADRPDRSRPSLAGNIAGAPHFHSPLPKRGQPTAAVQTCLRSLATHSEALGGASLDHYEVPTGEGQVRAEVGDVDRAAGSAAVAVVVQPARVGLVDDA